MLPEHLKSHHLVVEFPNTDLGRQLGDLFETVARKRWPKTYSNDKARDYLHRVVLLSDGSDWAPSLGHYSDDYGNMKRLVFTEKETEILGILFACNPPPVLINGEPTMIAADMASFGSTSLQFSDVERLYNEMKKLQDKLDS